VEPANKDQLLNKGQTIGPGLQGVRGSTSCNGVQEARCESHSSGDY